MRYVHHNILLYICRLHINLEGATQPRAMLLNSTTIIDMVADGCRNTSVRRTGRDAACGVTSSKAARACPPMPLINSEYNRI